MVSKLSVLKVNGLESEVCIKFLRKGIVSCLRISLDRLIIFFLFFKNLL